MNNIQSKVDALNPDELKRQWTEAWGLTVPAKIGQKMLKKSLVHKLKERAGLGLTSEDQARLKRLVDDYKRGKTVRRTESIKSGTRLIRVWQGKKHSVLVTDKGFEYNGLEYGSLSKIAAVITGTKWNGLVFFGLKKKGPEVAAS